MDGTQQHLLNTDTNQFYTQIGCNELWSDTIEGCISDTFVVRVDEAWPLEGDLCLIINDVVLKKNDNAKH